MPNDVEHRQHVVNTERTPAGDAFARLSITVLQLANHLTAAGDVLTRPLGQTSARWQVLAAAGQEAMSVAQIARALGLARQGVQRLADLIEGEGLARYEDNPAHRRAKLLVLTPKGREVLAAIRARQAIWANALGARLEEGEMYATSKLLSRMLEAVKEEPARG
jgi:DNA-binding MarR family transcriptional regulator